MFTEENLRKRLAQMTAEQMTELLVQLYKYHPEVQSDIHKVAVTQDDSDTVLKDMDNYSPGECKTALLQKVKGIKDRRGKVLCYFDFVEWILSRKDKIDFRFISVASASFGKAMEILGKDKALWDEMLERSYSIADQFYKMDGAVAYKAVEYYVRTKRGFD